MTSQPAATTPHVVQSQKVPAEAVPVTPAKASGKTGPQGMPEGYSGQEVNNPDNIEMKHAGKPKSVAIYYISATEPVAPPSSSSADRSKMKQQGSVRPAALLFNNCCC